MNKKIFLLTKKILFPGLDIGLRKRMKLAKYFQVGDILTLDAGCGNGAFGFKAVKKGNRVIGVDFNEEKLKRCEEFRDYLKIDPSRCRFRVHNLYELLSLNEKFDQITAKSFLKPRTAITFGWVILLKSLGKCLKRSVLSS